MTDRLLYLLELLFATKKLLSIGSLVVLVECLSVSTCLLLECCVELLIRNWRSQGDDNSIITPPSGVPVWHNTTAQSAV